MRAPVQPSLGPVSAQQLFTGVVEQAGGSEGRGSEELLEAAGPGGGSTGLLQTCKKLLGSSHTAALSPCFSVGSCWAVAGPSRDNLDLRHRELPLPPCGSWQRPDHLVPLPSPFSPPLLPPSPILTPPLPSHPALLSPSPLPQTATSGGSTCLPAPRFPEACAASPGPTAEGRSGEGK